jgi:hypothetical protein
VCEKKNQKIDGGVDLIAETRRKGKQARRHVIYFRQKASVIVSIRSLGKRGPSNRPTCQIFAVQPWSTISQVRGEERSVHWNLRAVKFLFDLSHFYISPNRHRFRHRFILNFVSRHPISPSNNVCVRLPRCYRHQQGRRLGI